jgi:hypothetical protein
MSCKTGTCCGPYCELGNTGTASPVTSNTVSLNDSGTLTPELSTAPIIDHLAVANVAKGVNALFAMLFNSRFSA